MLGEGDAQALNDKEMAILRLLAEGYAHKEIAGQLDRTVPAVSFDIRMLEAKLGARNGAHAIAIAFRRGILK